MDINVSINVDYREHAIIDLIKNKETTLLMNYTTSNLLIGDFVIKNEKGEIFYVIERKTINDLASSITDGRFREQKARLLNSYKDPSKIIYIIEGTKSILPIGRINKDIINSALLNLLFKHNYTVIFTQNTQDTLDNLLLLCQKISKNELTSAPLTDFSNIKKSDSKDIFVNQLCVIKGTSIIIAKKIKEHYASMNILIKKYNSFDTVKEKELLLTNIQITEKRKLGKVLSTNIYHALH